MRPRQGLAWGDLCCIEWSERPVMLRWGGQDDRLLHSDYSDNVPTRMVFIQVRIHNIRSGRPEPEIEILYAVYQDEKVGSSASGCWGCCGYCLFLMLFFGFVEITFPVDICCLPTRRRDRKNCLEKCPHESYKMCLPGSSASSGGRPSGRWKRWSRSSGLFSFNIFYIHVSYFFKQLKLIRGNESFILMSTFSGSSSRTRPQDKSRAWVLSLPYSLKVVQKYLTCTRPPQPTWRARQRVGGTPHQTGW